MKRGSTTVIPGLRTKIIAFASELPPRRVALRAKDLSSLWKYLQLAEFCRAQGREDEALRHAEEGLWMFEDDRPDERLVFFAVELLSKVGRSRDAEAHLWRAFEKAPSLELYIQIRQLGGEAACNRALSILEARLAGEAPTSWYYPADFLISILTHGKMLRPSLGRGSPASTLGRSKNRVGEQPVEVSGLNSPAFFPLAMLVH